MKNVHNIKYKKGSKEELLPDLEPDFPYISSYTELDKHIGRQVPWHWHKEVELFYIENGILEYYTPNGKTVFPTGSGGFVNSNVLHMTKPEKGVRDTKQMIHIFNSSIISGQHGSLLEQKYVTPIVTAPNVEIIELHPHNPKEAVILDLLVKSFHLSIDSFDYELKLRSVLSELWCMLLQVSEPLWKQKTSNKLSNDKIKRMMEYIHENYAEKITISEIAAAGYISERECFRTFSQKLKMTPAGYLQSYRIQKACNLLLNSEESLAYIGQSCGLGSNSYFGKVFRENMGCTPKEYRKKRLN